MEILRVFAVKILNFKSARSLLSTLFIRAARALLFFSSLKLGALEHMTAKIANFGMITISK
jgi:hypothetical protein